MFIVPSHRDLAVVCNAAKTDSKVKWVLFCFCFYQVKNELFVVILRIISRGGSRNTRLMEPRHLSGASPEGRARGGRQSLRPHSAPAGRERVRAVTRALPQARGQGTAENSVALGTGIPRPLLLFQKQLFASGPTALATLPPSFSHTFPASLGCLSFYKKTVPRREPRGLTPRGPWRDDTPRWPWPRPRESCSPLRAVRPPPRSPPAASPAPRPAAGPGSEAASPRPQPLRRRRSPRGGSGEPLPARR